MRYLLFFVFFLSNFSFAQVYQGTFCDSLAVCNSFISDLNARPNHNEWGDACVLQPNPPDYACSRIYLRCPSPTVNDPSDGTKCICPAGQKMYETEMGSTCGPASCPAGKKINISGGLGNLVAECIDDDTTNTPPDSDCDAGQVFFEGFCRDGVASPGDCGSTYTTAVRVGDLYACSNSGCSAGQNQSVFTNPNGSWNVCGGEGDGNGSNSSVSNSSSGEDSSTGGNSSAPSSNGGSGDSSSGSGSGTGGGSGNGSGNGTGDGSGSASSSPNNPGSGSASSGIGLGGEADASNCENGEPHCEGDPVQCAILVQLWINACAGYDQQQTNNPEDDNEAIEASFVALISSAEPSVNSEGVLTAMTPGGGNGNGSGSGSGPGTGSGNGGGSGIDLSGLEGAAGSGVGGTCPSDRSIRLGAGNFNISYQFFCDFASQISSLVILIFSYIGGMIIYRSLDW